MLRTRTSSVSAAPCRAYNGRHTFRHRLRPNLLRRSDGKDEEYYSRLRTLLDPERSTGGVPRERVEHALRRSGRASRNEVSVVVALPRLAELPELQEPVVSLLGAVVLLTRR